MELLLALRTGEAVYLTAVRNALTATEWVRFQRTVCIPSERIPFEILPYLQPYFTRLRVADKKYYSAKRALGKRSRGCVDLFREAEEAYERAIETLEETIGDVPALGAYLAPQIEDHSLCPGGMPRLLPSAHTSIKVVHVRAAIDFLQRLLRNSEDEHFER